MKTRRYALLAALLLACAFPRWSRAQLNGSLPAPLLDLIAADHRLPRQYEAYYHPLGRSPVADAVLGDPLYLPSYGRQVSRALREAAALGQAERLLLAAHRAGGLPAEGEAEYRSELRQAGLGAIDLPFLEDKVGPLAHSSLTRAWQLFLYARQIAEAELEKLGESERAWLRDNAENYFFGEKGSSEYAYFTDDTGKQLETFRLAARLDLSEFARAARCLAFAADLVRKSAPELRRFGGHYEHVVDAHELPNGRHAGARFVLAGAADDLHDEDAEMLVDVGGNDSYRNNAGGTRGILPAALLVDLGGDDRYEGDFAVQGAGFLGVGALVDVRGDDIYQAAAFSQGAAWCGSALFLDLQGADEYRGDFFVQGAAGYGSVLFWEAEGNDIYQATGMAQAASTTLGSAFLVETSGDDRMRCGWRAREFWTRAIGIGHGGAVGMRDYPWRDKPAFYGGVAFLDDAGGNDDLYCPMFCQGGAYMLGVGVLVATGGDDRYESQSNGQGAVVHLAAGLMIDEGGNDTYVSDWGGMGVGGDRSAGILIDTEGNDTYRGGSHNLGSARKPNALGLFIDVAGDDAYRFSDDSCARVQNPADPEHWPTALFLDLGGRDVYPIGDKSMKRGDGDSWNHENRGIGLDTSLTLHDLAGEIWRAFPARPRVAVPFNPLGGWPDNLSHRALPAMLDSLLSGQASAAAGMRAAPGATGAEDWYMELGSSGYERRRQIYEELDLLRYAGVGPDLNRLLPLLLDDPQSAPEDLVEWSALWAEVDGVASANMGVARALMDERVSDPSRRRLLIRMLGATVDEAAVSVLRDRLVNDLDPVCRREAALALGRSGFPAALGALSGSLEDPEAVVRISICAGLRESEAPEALSLLLALIDDDDLYVRRQAALSGVSIGHKPAVPRLLRELRVVTLDTGENYGDNLYSDLGRYVGRDLYERFGVDFEAWLAWWRQYGADFNLDAAIAAERARRLKEGN